MRYLLPFLALSLFLLFSIGTASALVSLSTQEYNKILLDPFYRQTMSSNTNYTYTIKIEPADGIQSVISAIIYFNAQINGQTQNFTLWVNGNSCNNPSYYIATAYSATGNMQFNFDCTNVIKTSGTYTITLRSAVNTGAISSWLELTYMNKPPVIATFFGTEYSAGEQGTLWLQLLRDYVPINNATCYLKVYKPDKTMFLDNIDLNYLSNSDGIYYYDFTVPSTLGVYMVSATCYIPSQSWFDSFIDYSKIQEWKNVTVEAGKVKLSTTYGELPNNKSIDDTANMTGNVLLYHLNEASGTIVDYSGEGNDGNTSGISYDLPGVFDKAVRALTTSYINAGNKPSLNIRNAITISMWINTTTHVVNAYPLYKAGYIAFYTNPSNTMRFYINLVGVGPVYINTGTYNVNEWHNIVGTYDKDGGAGNFRVYKDGVLQNSASYSAQISDTSAYNLYLGSNAGANGWSGIIDEVAIWNRSLSATEVSYLYNRTATNIANQGYLISIPVTLPSDADEWYSFGADFLNNDGNTTFSILNSNNTIICSSLGNISTCANATSPVKLMANFSINNTNNTITPWIDKWWVDWIPATIESEIRGSGEIHVSIGTASVNVTEIWDYENRTLTNFTFDINQSLILNATDYILNATLDVGKNLTSVNESLTEKIISVNETVKAANQTIMEFLQSIPSLIWSYGSRVVDVSTASINDILSPIGAWIAGNFTYTNQKIDILEASIYNNLTYLNGTTWLIPEWVWSYQNRTLTSFPIVNSTFNVTDIWTYPNRTVDTSYLESMIQSVNNTVISMNSSIFTKLFLMQDELASINNTMKDINSTLSSQITDVYNDIQTVKSYVVSINDTVISVNITVLAKLAEIQNEMLSINSTLMSELGDIKGNILSINTTLYGKLESLQSDLVSLNDTVKNVNSSLSIQITDVYSHVTEILDNLLIVNDTILSINITTMNELYSMHNDLLLLASNFTVYNETMVSEFNTLESMLSSMNNTFLNINASIFEKLRLIQYDLLLIEENMVYPSSMCYQNNPKIATSCGGLSTGNYSPSNDAWTPGLYYSLNYTKPIGATQTNSVWQVKHGRNVSAYNITIPPECWYQSSTMLMLRIYSEVHSESSHESHPECYDGTSWIMIGYNFSDNSTETLPGHGVYGSTWLYDNDWSTWSAYLDIFGSWINNYPSLNASVYEQGMYWQLGYMSTQISNISSNINDVLSYLDYINQTVVSINSTVVSGLEDIINNITNVLYYPYTGIAASIDQSPEYTGAVTWNSNESFVVACGNYADKCYRWYENGTSAGSAIDLSATDLEWDGNDYWIIKPTADYAPLSARVNISGDTWAGLDNSITSSCYYTYGYCSGMCTNRCMKDCKFANISAWPNCDSCASYFGLWLRTNNPYGTGSSDCGTFSNKKASILWFNLSSISNRSIKNVTLHFNATSTASYNVNVKIMTYESHGNPYDFVWNLTGNDLWNASTDEQKEIPGWWGEYLATFAPNHLGWYNVSDGRLTNYTANQSQYGYDDVIAIVMGEQMGTQFNFNSMEEDPEFRPWLEVEYDIICGDGYCMPPNETQISCPQDCSETVIHKYNSSFNEIGSFDTNKTGMRGITANQSGILWTQTWNGNFFAFNSTLGINDGYCNATNSCLLKECNASLADAGGLGWDGEYLVSGDHGNDSAKLRWFDTDCNLVKTANFSGSNVDGIGAVNPHEVWLGSRQNNTVYKYYIERLTPINFTTDLSGLEGMIISVNSTMLNVNSSLFNKLYLIQDDLVSINNTIKDTNSSLSSQLTGIYLHIDDVIDDIVSANDTLKSVNSTIMSKLSTIQNELAGINTTDLIISLGYNLTNVNQTLADQIAGLTLLTSEEVWNYTARTLTGFNYTVNSTTPFNASEVWSYEIRNLTYYPSHINATVENVSTVLNALSTFSDLKYAGGTEYKYAEDGHLAYQFIYTGGGTPVPMDYGWCNISIWYPNKTLMVEKVNMTYLPTSSGLYYYNFTIPDVEGVYASVAECSNLTINAYGSSSFHVAPWANQIYNVSTKVYSLSSDIWNYPTRTLTDYNQSDILSILNNVNNTVNSILSNQISINQTTMDKLNSMSLDLATITSLLNSINETVTVENSTINLIYDYVADINSTLWNEIMPKLNEIQGNLTQLHNDLISVNTTIGNLNLTVNVNLTSITDSLGNITGQLVNISSFLVSHNDTVVTMLGDIQGNLTTIQNSVVSVNNTILNVNSTTLAQLVTITDSLNYTINFLTNQTNITVAVTANISKDVDNLYGRLRDFMVAYFTSGDPTNQTCIANDTLRVYNTYTMNIQDPSCPTCTGLNSTKFVDLHCAYGCDAAGNPAQCLTGSPFNIFIFLIMSGLGMYLMFGRKDPIINIIGALIFIVGGAFTMIYGIDLSLLFGMTSIMIKNIATFLMGLVFVGLGIYRIASAWARLSVND